MTKCDWRFGRFCQVGLLGAVLQVLLIVLLTKCFGILSVAATLIAVEITILHNFIWHERFTWNDRSSKLAGQLAVRLWRFHVGNGLVSLGGNTVLTYCLIERLKVSAVPMAIGGIVLCALANFGVANRWVYKDLAVRGRAQTQSVPDH